MNIDYENNITYSGLVNREYQVIHNYLVLKIVWSMDMECSTIRMARKFSTKEIGLLITFKDVASSRISLSNRQLESAILTISRTLARYGITTKGSSMKA